MCHHLKGRPPAVLQRPTMSHEGPKLFGKSSFCSGGLSPTWRSCPARAEVLAAGQGLSKTQRCWRNPCQLPHITLWLCLMSCPACPLGCHHHCCAGGAVNQGGDTVGGGRVRETHHTPAQSCWPLPTGVWHNSEGGCHIQRAVEHTAIAVSPWPGKEVVGALAHELFEILTQTSEQCFLLCPFPAL